MKFTYNNYELVVLIILVLVALRMRNISTDFFVYIHNACFALDILHASSCHVHSANFCILKFSTNS